MKGFWVVLALMVVFGCDKPTSDDLQRVAQEKILAEGTRQVTMPNIVNFRERRIVHDLLELRDQEQLVTYTYIWSPMRGQFLYLGQSVGYGIPAATQYTNPQKVVDGGGTARAVIPQADPNGLFSPSSVEATWVLLVNPKTQKVEPQYIEDRINVFTYKLPADMVMNGTPFLGEKVP